MISFLAGLFINDSKNFTNKKVRSSYGMLCGTVGIILNIILCSVKFAASSLTGSVSVAADAMNNLSDAGSSLISLLGFKLASQKPDPDHPFGHGRFEYISGFIIAMLIIIMGYELGKESVSTIVNGSYVKFSIASVIILSISIAVKLYMFFYNNSIGRKIDSSAMKAAGTDSLSDCVSTGAVLVCTVLSRFISFNIDGWCGLAVALFVLRSGIMTAKDTLDPLLGMPPEQSFVDQINQTVMSFPHVKGIHDLIVHNYGPGRVMISLHAEMPQDIDIITLHDTVDNIEKELENKLGCSAVIHLDPIAVGDKLTETLRSQVSAAASEIDEKITIHDFRIVNGKSHTNLIFDIVLPFNIKLSDSDIKKIMSEKVKKINENYVTVITVDRSFIKQ